METIIEHLLTNTYKDEMISYIAMHPEAFDEVIKLAISEKPPYSWRAAWVLWSIMEENDKRVQIHIKSIIDSISTKKDNQQRELFKVLHKMELNEEYAGQVFIICVDVWEKIHKKPSVRMNALHLMVKIAQKYPELSNEIELLTQDQYLDSMSQAVYKSITKLKKRLDGYIVTPKF